MRNVIRFFVQHHIVGDLLMIAIIIAGIVGMTNLRSNFFPETQTKVIIIQVVYPGASPEEIEEGVVAKIEENLQGLANIDQVSSTSIENAASIKITVVNAKETDEVLQNVKNAVDKIPSFPMGMEPPIIFKQEFEKGQDNMAIVIALTGVEDLHILKKAARKIESELRRFDGVSQVSLSGFPEEEIEIAISENKLSEMGLTIAQVAQIVRSSNIETTGGRIKTSKEEFTIRGRFKEYSTQSLRDIVILSTVDGKIVRLSDIADVQEKWVDTDPTRNWFNGKTAVAITVSNLNSESILDVVEIVRAYMSAFNETNTDLQLDVIVDMSIILNQRIDLLANNGIIGFLLVILFLALFLNHRLAFWVALAIPVSFAGMFMLAGLAGITINVISLFGMILVIGILVDDGIVIAENIYQKFERGASRLEATIEGTMEVLPAVFSAIVTTVIAFSAFFFIEGKLGDIFQDMATVIILTLVFSLIEGAFILPAHVGNSNALKRSTKKNKLETWMSNAFISFRDTFYAPVLKFSLKQPWVAFSVIVAVFMITVPGLIGGGFVKTTFFPHIEGDNLSVTLTMKSGTRAEVTQEKIDRIEAVVWEVNKEFSALRGDTLKTVLTIDKRLGPLSHIAMLNIQLIDGENRLSQSSDISNRIREKVGVVYGAENLTYGEFSPFGRPIALSFLGNDMESLSLATEEFKAQLALREDVKDIIDSNQEGVQEISVTLKPRAYQLGFTRQELLSQIRQAFYGHEVQRLQKGRDEVRVWVRLDESDRASVSSLENFTLRTITGDEVLFHEICEINIERGVAAINRIYGMRQVEVSADLSGPTASATDVTAAINQEILPPILAKYPNVTASFEGQSREVTKSTDSMARVMPLILALMFLVIVLTFRSPLQAMAVFGLIPFGLVGISFGHWILDAQISLFSALGMIALMGILVNDALVFVAAYNSYLKSGKTVDESIWEAGMNRFRPIVLTSVTTVAGLAPLMLNKSFQAQFLIPMAISVAFGLLFVTVIILILLPVYLKFISPLHRAWIFIVKGDSLSGYNAEPAVRELVIDAEFVEESKSRKTSGGKSLLVIILFISTSTALFAQGSTVQDLSLQDAVHLSLESNYGIRIAELNTEITSINNHWGTAGALPQVGVSVSGNSSIMDNTLNPTSVIMEKLATEGLNTGVNMNWTLFDGMGMFATKSRLELLVTQSENQASLVIEQTVAAVDFSYHNVLVQIKLLDVLAESMQLSRIRLNQVVYSEQYGVAGTFDRLQFENAIIADSSSWLLQGVAVANSIRNLNRVMGVDESSHWNFTTELNTPPILDNVTALKSTVALDNTSVRNAVLSHDIATQSVKMAEARLYPVVGLGATYGDSRSQVTSGAWEGDGMYSSTSAISLSINFNLFNGGATRRAIAMASIQADIAAIGIEDKLAEAESLVANAFDRYTMQATIYDLSQQSVKNAETMLEIADSQYEGGVISSLDYRSLEIALQRARTQELQSLLAWRSSYMEVQKLIGNLRAPLVN